MFAGTDAPERLVVLSLRHLIHLVHLSSLLVSTPVGIETLAFVVPSGPFELLRQVLLSGLPLLRHIHRRLIWCRLLGLRLILLPHVPPSTAVLRSEV
jgi:hypothetical protein